MKIGMGSRECAPDDRLREAIQLPLPRLESYAFAVLRLRAAAAGATGAL
jgi:hypothetical protein